MGWTHKNNVEDAIKNKPEYASKYVSAALTDSPEAFLMALRNVADATGGVSALAKRTGLKRESIYRMLRARGNPTLNSILKLLKGLKLEVSVVQRDD